MVDRDGEHSEDMSGSYASVTLVNPDGREFFYDNIKVDGNTVEFMITEDMTDDLDEIGIYTLQIHINNELSPGDYSVFSVPPFNFEVLPRLGGSIEDIYLADSEGFELVDIIPPDYGYTKGQNDYINKEKLKDCHLSNDYYRIYDCGQYKYEWKNVN